MPWAGTAGSQVFTRTAGGSYSGSTCWTQTDNDARGIRADDHDTHDQDMADAINACLKKDGGNTASGHISMGGFKLAGLAAATAAGEAVRFEQLPSGVMTTRGDMDYYGASGIQRLPKGAVNQLLIMGADDPYWFTCGTATFYNVSSSGANVPLMSVANTWSAQQSISQAATGSHALYLTKELSGTAILRVNGNSPGTAGDRYIDFILDDTTTRGAITVDSGAGIEIVDNSDGRMKFNRRIMEDADEILDELRVYWFNWLKPDGPRDFGLVAQEVAETKMGFKVSILGDGDPDKRVGDEGFEPAMMDYTNFIPPLIAAYQKLKARVAQLEGAV